MNATTNYQLSQWEASDRVLRTDFNADNAKIEAALSSLEARATALDSLASKLTFYVGQLSLAEVDRTRKAIFPASAVNEQFLHTSNFTASKGIVFREGKVVLEGEISSGTVTCGNYITTDRRWSRAHMWVGHMGGAVTATVNGVPMEPGVRYQVIGGTGVLDFQEFTCSGLTSGYSVPVTLGMDRGRDASMEIHNFTLMLY